MSLQLSIITFDQIYPIWQKSLWPERQSAIESHSAMNLGGGYNMYNMSTEVTFFAFLDNAKIVAVNSGHPVTENMYRSRGLFVSPEYRGRGLGKELLLATIAQGKKHESKIIWSYPKKSSWNTYRSVGFNLYSDWEQSELDINAYCTLSI
jgi:GNAT superfamily N-acetyltransferase